jgi:rare lipoprotein A
MPSRVDPIVVGAMLAICAMPQPSAARDQDETGMASWYGEELRGSRTANGERFDPDGMSAAHPTLPMSSYVEVTSIDTGRAVVVRINDRGPFHSNRIIDLSLGAARQLGITGHGAHRVRVHSVDPGEAEKLALRNPPPPPRQAASAPIPAGPGPFFLQVASFSSEQRARTLGEKLRASVTSIAGTWRVRLGPYESAIKAMAALAPLAARGYPNAVITR